MWLAALGSALWLGLSGCGEKPAPPPPAPTGLGSLANQIAGRTNTPPPPKEEPKLSTREVLELVAGPKAATNAVAGSFLDGLRDKAKRGDADAMYWLGFYHSTGKEVEKNLEEGLRWYLESAERNHEKAQLAAGIAFEEGLGTPKDPAAAYQWLHLAALKGNLDAIERRDKLAAKIPDYEMEKGRRMAEQFVPK